MSALRAPASTSSPSWMSIARLTFPSRLALKSLAGSCNAAPLAKVNFTLDLYDSPVQMMPSCDHTGVPIHFHSSTTFGSAALMSLRIRLKVFPRQSPSSAIFLSISRDADVMAFAVATTSPTLRRSQRRRQRRLQHLDLQRSTDAAGHLQRRIARSVLGLEFRATAWQQAIRGEVHEAFPLDIVLDTPELGS